MNRLPTNTPAITPISMQHKQRQYPTMTLGTVFLLDNITVVDELTHFADHIDGDLRNYTDRELQHANNICLELTDCYPSKRVSINNESYVPPIADWDIAKVTITPTTQSTLSHPIQSNYSPDLEVTFLVERIDLEHTLERSTILDSTAP